MELVHQTEKHDWYKERIKNFPGIGYTMLYNIVPKGEESPTSGYLQPRVIMDKKGYHNLKVFQTFNKSNCN
jgi:hypothetical protein